MISVTFDPLGGSKNSICSELVDTAWGIITSSHGGTAIIRTWCVVGDAGEENCGTILAITRRDEPMMFA